MNAPDSQLDRIEAKLDRLEHLLSDLPGLAAAVGDTFDDVVDRLPGGAAEFDQRLRRASDLGLALSDPSTLDQMGRVLATLVAASGDLDKEPADRIGVFALLRILREPEIQRSIAFLVQCGRRFGADADKELS